MRYDSPVATLLESAAGGAESAWDEIVRRYSPLVLAVCRRYGLTGADAEDVAGNVWMRLVAKMITIREPAALPGWLATTARRECLMVLRDKHRMIPHDQRDVADQVEPGADTSLLVEERRSAVRDACAGLPQRDRELLTMLFSDPPRSYMEISSSLGMPVGAIGPTRQRCLTRVRRAPAVAALLVDERHLGSNHDPGSGAYTSQRHGSAA
jgi:RNA polymerase sigma factor (sigma-70 family)